MTLVDILHNSAQQHPNCAAVTMKRGYRTVTLTYAELYTLAKRVAVLLADNGIQPGENIVMLAPNSPYWVAVFFGIIMRGCHTVPLNTQSTQEFVNRTLEHTQSKIFFKHVFFKEAAPENVAVFDIDFIDELVADCPAERYEPATIHDNDLVQILYTSGTTGDPKGSMLTHHNLVSNVVAVGELIHPVSGKDRILSVLPLSHILEQTVGMLLPIYKGVEIIYAHSPAAIAPLMKKYHITKMVGVPEFLQIIRSRVMAQIQQYNLERAMQWAIKIAQKINNPRFSRILFYPILKPFGGKLDTLASGGAPLSPDLEAWWNNLGVRILQGYGLTETSPIVTTNTYEQHRFASVGKILPGVQVQIAADGEIWVKGPNVFHGYYRGPELTEKTFTDDGWFKTGDMGAFDADGFLFLRGRKKYMILGPGGQNVFPEDIEEVLNRIAGIKDSTVIGIERDHEGVEIHASLLLADPSINAETTITQANEKLASYQQITGWSVWPEEDFPRSATRKVKKEVVRTYILGKREPIQKMVTTLSPLVHILSQISGIEAAKIVPTMRLTNDLQFDSLRRIELVARIEQDLHVTIDETALTPTLTVEQLQEMIRTKAPTKPLPELSRWPRWFVIRVIRFVLQELFFLFSRIFMRIQVQGKENLDTAHGPLLIMPNHASYWDAFVITRALPLRTRWRLSLAAAQDVVYGEYKYFAWLAELTFNCFPLPRQEGENIKIGLENSGRMLDAGYHVVIFPEGKMSVDGSLLPFKEGAGLFATQMNAPVVMIKISGIQKIFPYDVFLPRSRTTIQVTIGKPMKFSRRAPYLQATQQLHDTLKGL